MWASSFDPDREVSEEMFEPTTQDGKLNSELKISLLFDVIGRGIEGNIVVIGWRAKLDLSPCVN